MTVLSARRLALCAIILLTSCRSEKVAFQFRPASAAATSASAVAEMPNLASLTPEPGPEPEQPAPAQEAQPKRSRALAARPTTPSRQLTRPQLRPARQEAQGLRARQAARPRRAADNESDVLHVVLGSLLIIGGVILGLLIGGWLGLGVGAGVVILGYYFLVMGIGGSHAWREIFQEFFNL